MDAPLSSYWVKFFKNAGFPTEHATRHAVIFSNNRIKPDMLPDLDKPSLKEMGITLMGDMIAILRYAKKVVEETTCKKFLVSSEDSPPSATKVAAKPTLKKVMAKPVVRAPATSKVVKLETPTKVFKTSSSSVVKPTVSIKKKVVSNPLTRTSKLYSDYIDTNQKPKVSPLKRKYDSDDDSDGRWKRNEELQKRLKALSDDEDDDDIQYKVLMPKEATTKSQQILKKAIEQKRTVFHRLGDSMVSSTTSIADSSNSNFSPKFKVTGISKERNNISSVFNRLGNKDNETLFNRNLRNGSGSSTATQGILKTRTPLLGTQVITTKPVIKKPVGTMRADEEANKKAVSESVRQLVRTTNRLKFNDSPTRNNNLIIRKKLPVTGKLASERMAVPAKSRLGVSKQVTFNKMATINHIKKQGVFSRLGV